MAAAAKGNLTALKRALRDGANVNATTDDEPDSIFFDGGRTPLMIAAGNGQLAAVRALIAAGATLDSVADNGHTALTEASEGDRALPIVKVLLAAGASLRPKRSKFTALYAAAEAGNLALAQLLLARKARVDERIHTGATPLMVAAAPAMVKLLLSHGAAPDLSDHEGNTALHAAAERRIDSESTQAQLRLDREQTTDIITALINAGASATVRNRKKETALDLLAQRDDDLLDAARLLLTHGAKPKPSSLVSAAAFNQVLIVSELLDHGADLDARDDEGKTALMAAACEDEVSLVQLLLDLGADATLRSPSGTAVQLAKHFNSKPKVVPVLKGTRRADIEVPWAGTCVLEAQRLYGRGNYQAALALFEWFPRSLRERIPAMASSLGYCYQQTKRHADALRCFEAAVSLAPRMTHALTGLCYSAYELKQWPTMLGYAQRATKARPRDSYAWQQLLLAQARLGNHEAAVKAGRRAIAVDPSNAHATAYLAVELRELDDPSWPALLRSALQLDRTIAREAEVSSALKDRAFMRKQA